MSNKRWRLAPGARPEIHPFCLGPWPMLTEVTEQQAVTVSTELRIVNEGLVTKALSRPHSGTGCHQKCWLSWWCTVCVEGSQLDSFNFVPALHGWKGQKTRDIFTRQQQVYDIQCNSAARLMPLPSSAGSDTLCHQFPCMTTDHLIMWSNNKAWLLPYCTVRHHGYCYPVSANFEACLFKKNCFQNLLFNP